MKVETELGGETTKLTLLIPFICPFHNFPCLIHDVDLWEKNVIDEKNTYERRHFDIVMSNEKNS